ncbi:MAG TPA: ABC transporter permease [Bryobacteraceae bacterium]|nr:ABC transporter permease [Bryobacteraceae bacterium]
MKKNRVNWRDLLPNPLRRASFLIRTAACLVPRSERAEWRREWLAELHFAAQAMRERDEPSARLVGFARGAFQDAAWHRLRDWNREKVERAVSRGAQSAGFCLAALIALLALIAVASGFLPETRAVLLPLPYADAGRIATVTQGGTTLATRWGIHREWVQWWRADSRLIEDAATYVWTEQTVDGRRTLAAKVSGNFFALLGLADAFSDCRDCAVLSHEFWRTNYGGKTPASIVIGTKTFRVAGVLDGRFWFLTRRIGVWTTEGPHENRNVRTGVVVRLRPDVSKTQAERDLESVVQKHGVNQWSSLIAISFVPDRVRSVFGSFALALILAIGTILPALRPNLSAANPVTWRAVGRAVFFCSKTALLLLAVLLAGLEFTRAASITMLGGTDLATEPLSTWLFLLGSMGALSWSIYDQRRRCRVCLRRYGLAAQIGCPGCILLSWSGTELVCLEGHGTLHVGEPVACWQEQDRWTSLDDSLLELFAQSD